MTDKAVMAEVWHLVRFKDDVAEGEPAKFYRARRSGLGEGVRWWVYGVFDYSYEDDELLDYGLYRADRDEDLVIWIDNEPTPTRGQIADMLDGGLARRAVADAMVVMGATDSWSGDTMMAMKEALEPAFPPNLPNPAESDFNGSVTFWRKIGGLD